MRVAVIDLGTNTFHLIIVELINGDFRVIYREKTSVRIGKDGITHGFITDPAQKRALTTLRHFKSIIDKEMVENIYATATSAIRNAKNGQELIEKIKIETGIEPEIISGLREAELIYFGVKKALSIGSEPALIMDIGGGSIEFIIGNDNEIFWKQSYEIGGQRMMEKFHKNDPIRPEEIYELHQYLADELTELELVCHKFRPKTLIGSSGTFDTLSEIFIHQEGGHQNNDLTEFPISITGFQRIYDEIISKNRKERKAIPGMIPMRVEMIVVAIILIKYILDSMGIDKMRVSAFALKEGVLLNTIASIHESKLEQ